jgi:glycosyltransferase involved in cell wall biosynthesis
MLEAFALLPADLRCTLDFIGDGPQRHSLEQRTKELNLEACVRFRGFQSNPYTWMMQSDLLALSSDREGLPTVLIEALYCGLRVVSTDCGGGIHDILRDGIFGAIVPAGNATKLAHAIATSLASSCDATHQTEGAQRFLPNVTAEQFLQAMNTRLTEFEV